MAPLAPPFSAAYAGLLLSMVRSSLAIKQVYNCELMMWVLYNEWTNCLRARVQARSFNSI